MTIIGEASIADDPWHPQDLIANTGSIEAVGIAGTESFGISLSPLPAELAFESAAHILTAEIGRLASPARSTGLAQGGRVVVPAQTDRTRTLII